MKYTPIVDIPKTGDAITEKGIPSEQFINLLNTIQDAINGKIYTVATVPDATKNEGRQIYVSDAAAGATIAFSDGTNWWIDQSTLLN